MIQSFLLLFLFSSVNAFALQTGKPAPDFKLKGSDGKEYRLSDFKGQPVVLEWLNHGCPFVKKHYKSGNMQRVQKYAAQKKVKWLSVISSAPGKQGHSTPEQAEKDRQEKGAATVDAVLLDPSGRVGRLYGARTTPNMYVIDPKGLLVYQGAIDSIRSADPADIPEATNYVQTAVDAVVAKKMPDPATTQPYGCSVKYKN